MHDYEKIFNNFYLWYGLKEEGMLELVKAISFVIKSVKNTLLIIDNVCYDIDIRGR